MKQATELKEKRDGFGLTFRTEAELNAAIAKLDDEKTRLEALEQLVSFSSHSLFRIGSAFVVTGSREKDALIEKAVKAVHRSQNFELIRLCLNSQKRMLLLFGFWNTPNENFGTKEEWESLVPRLRELASGADANWRYRAQECLRSFSGQEEFLAECLKNETDLYNINKLVESSRLPPDEFDNKMNSYVLRFLADKDEEFRCEALGFLHRTWNPSQAQGEIIFTRVLELSRSTSIKERKAAVDALGGFGWQNDTGSSYDSEKNRAINAWFQHNSETIRNRIFELARDESEGVRQSVVFALDLQKNRADVRVILKQLLQDKSANVRFDAILVLGSEKCIKELKALAEGSDKKIAEEAATELKAIQRYNWTTRKE